jgi:hypothetical protein
LDGQTRVGPAILEAATARQRERAAVTDDAQQGGEPARAKPPRKKRG